MNDRLLDLWSRTSYASNGEMRERWYEALSAPNAGAWGPTKLIYQLMYPTADPPDGALDVLNDLRGDVFIVVRNHSGTMTLAEHRVNHGTRVRVLRKSVYRGSVPLAEMAGDGAAVLTWSGSRGIETMYLTAKWHLSRPHLMEGIDSIEFGINDRGLALLTWGADGIWTTTIKPSGAWGAPQEVVHGGRTQAYGDYPSTTLNDRGQAVIFDLRTIHRGTHSISRYVVFRGQL